MKEEESYSHPEIIKVSRIFRALAYPKRLEILMTLSTEDFLTFSQLLNIIDLGKTALANHLSELEKLNLVSKPKRGVYAITKKGLRFLNLNTSLYEETNISEDNNYSQSEVSISKDSKSNQNSSQNSKNSDSEIMGDSSVLEEPEPSKINSNVPKSLECETRATFIHHNDSFVGSLTGILQSLGKDYDTVDVAGITGLSYFIRIPKDLEHASPEIPYSSKFLDEISENAKYFGISLQKFEIKSSFPSSSHTITLEDLAKAQKLFREVVYHLNENRHPNIIWGGPFPGFYIVNGFNGYNYILNGLSPTGKIEDFEWRFDMINSPDFMQVWSISQNSAINSTINSAINSESKSERKSAKNFKENQKKSIDEQFIHNFIDLFIQLLSGDEFQNEKFWAGIDALRYWAEYLSHSSLKPDRFNFPLQKRFAEDILTQISDSAEFLRRIVENFPRKNWNHYVERSIFHLQQSHKHMLKFPVLFHPNLNEQEFSASRKGGVILLQKTAECMENALKSLQSAEVLL